MRIKARDCSEPRQSASFRRSCHKCGKQGHQVNKSGLDRLRTFNRDLVPRLCEQYHQHRDPFVKGAHIHSNTDNPPRPAQDDGGFEAVYRVPELVRSCSGMYTYYISMLTNARSSRSPNNW